VKNHRDIVVACGMNCDAFDVPLLQPKVKRLAYVFEVLEFVKGPVRSETTIFTFNSDYYSHCFGAPRATIDNVDILFVVECLQLCMKFKKKIKTSCHVAGEDDNNTEWAVKRKQRWR
jgi:hypothetical protein